MSATSVRWGLAARLARRELRGGLRGFWIFLGCLVLGVAAIATVNSLASGVQSSLRDDGRAILGGDVSLRLVFIQADEAQRATLESLGDVSEIVEARAMARTIDGEDSSLVELKAVDDVYPLYGEMDLAPPLPIDEALGQIDGVWGAVADETILTRHDLSVGDRLRIGEIEIDVRAVIEEEPDRAAAGAFVLGPRLMVSRGAIEAAGLLQPGSLVYWNYRLRLPQDLPAEDAIAAIRAAHPEAGWSITDFSDAAPQLQTMIDRLALFLTLVGLTALLVGGVGIGNAVKAFVDTRIATIATLKCLGAEGRLIFRIYFIQILILAGLGIIIGLIVGAVVPVLVGDLVSELLPISVSIGIYPSALLLAAGFGVLTTLAFSIWPIAKARDIPAASLFRNLIVPTTGWPRLPYVLATVVTTVALAALAIGTADRPDFAAWFVAGAVVVVLAFRLVAIAIVAIVRVLPRSRRMGVRLATSNLTRAGAPTANLVLSLGLGLTVLVAISLIEGNMSRQVQDQIPDQAPSFFFVDIQPDQREPFEAAAYEQGASQVVEVPSLRGRIVAANGVPAAEALQDPEESWLIEGDRGVSYATEPSDRYTIIDGEWWAPDYAGPPLISVYRDIANAFGLGVGDTLTINVLGRDIEAEVANVRDIDWSTINVNFTMVLSPEPLVNAPHTLIATVRIPPDQETGLQRAIGEAFPNVTAVRVADALDTVNEVLLQIGTAVRAVAAVTLIAGTLVLGGAIAAGHRRRVYDAVVLKVLGATRGNVIRAFLVEYGLLGLVAALIATAVGTIAAWAVLTEVMNVDEWIFLPLSLTATALIALGITLALGLAGTWLALRRKAAPLLRNE
ncbi:MAG: FtsX-like permease family protein [Pseudomonadota bacterium]